MTVVRIAFPDWDRTELELAAIKRAPRATAAPVDQLTVNMLRHEFTSYDAHRSREAHTIVCVATATRFPWLRAECERQMLARSQRDAWRQQRLSESREAAAQFVEGMLVSGRIKGDVRDAVVVKVGDTRLTVRYAINGVERVVRVYARDVTPVDSGEEWAL